MANDSVTLGGKAAQLRGAVPQAGSKAPEFTFVTDKLEEKSSYELGHKALVIIAVPSLDTGVCAKETRRFNELLEKREGTIGLTMSMDLPFAMKRFCELEGITNLMAGTDFRYREFAEAYNADIIEGPFKGLFARAIFVVDADNTIRYTELVPEIGQEPDYDKVLAEVDKIVG
jgi:thiol peroxidase